jgi:hypothetical protein
LTAHSSETSRRRRELFRRAGKIFAVPARTRQKSLPVTEVAAAFHIPPPSRARTCARPQKKKKIKMRPRWRMADGGGGWLAGGGGGGWLAGWLAAAAVAGWRRRT